MRARPGAVTDPIGATVFALAIDPSVPSTLYAGAGTGTDNGNGGGVFKSTDAGATWGATGLTNTFVGALAIDPIAPETLYAGTGYYQHDGGGVFRSTDAGATWSATGLTNIFGLGALGIDPRMPSTLFASPGGGVFTSTDSGATWNAANTGLPEDPTGNTYVSALVIDPVTPRTLYAATYSGIFKSTNGGGTWTGANEGVDPTCAAGFLEDGSMDHPHLGICNGPEEVRFSGMGSAGSARLDLRLESWSIEPTQSDGGHAPSIPPTRPMVSTACRVPTTTRGARPGPVLRRIRQEKAEVPGSAPISLKLYPCHMSSRCVSPPLGPQRRSRTSTTNADAPFPTRSRGRP